MASLVAPLQGQHVVIEELQKRLMRIESRSHKVAGKIGGAVAGFDPGSSAVLHQNFRRFLLKQDLTARVRYRGNERAGERRRTAHTHLRFPGAGQQRRNVVSEATAAEIDLAQAVEEQKASLHHGVLEFALDEFERRQRAYVEKQPPLGAVLQQPDPPFGRNRRRLALGNENVLNDRQKIILPAPQAGLVLRAESAHRRGGPLEVSPPLEHIAAAQNERHV